MTVSNYKILKRVYSNVDLFKERLEERKGYSLIDVELRVNWKCNAKCIMCGLRDYIANSSQHRKREMSYNEITNLFDQLKNLGCVSVTLSGGEPTLRDDLTQIVAYAVRACGMSVSLNTNAYLLDDAKLKDLIEAGVESFTFSLDSPVEEIHDSIRGLKGSFKNIVRAIDYINTYCEQYAKRVWVFINCVILKPNIESLAGFKNFHQKHRYDHLNLSPASINTPWDEWSASRENLRPTVEDVLYLKKKVLPELQDMDCGLCVADPFGDEEDEIERNTHVIFSGRPQQCFVPMVYAVIQCNGDVIPCCYAPDSFVMGNVTEKAIAEIWDGGEYMRFRQECINLNYRMCASCLEYELINTKIGNKLG